MEILNQKPDPNKENIIEQASESGWKQWAPLTILLVAAAIVGWQLGQPKSPAPEISKNVEQSRDLSKENEASAIGSLPKTEISKPSTGEPKKPESQESKTAGNIRMEGLLLPSDDPARGNIILKVGENKKYLWTTKDIRNLVNKTVVVEGSGTMESFVVLDLIPQIDK